MKRVRLGLCMLGMLAASSAAMASEYHGLVTSGGLPVPGATVTVTQGSKKNVAITDLQGFYSFPALSDGPATVDVEMTGYTQVKQEVTIAPNVAMGKAELQLLSLEQIRAALKPVLSAGIAEAQTRSEPKRTSETPKQKGEPVPPSDEVAQRAAEGLLINGSVNNAATSRFTLAQRFGNTASGRSLYSFSLNTRLNNSVFDARSWSPTGIDTSKPDTSQITGGFALEGPLKIPGLLRNGPNIFVGYQRTRDSVAVTTAGLVPNLAERDGDFSQAVNAQGQPVVIYDPTTGQPYPGNRVPINPQARALLNLYPLPNFTGSSQYNYQIPLITDTHKDALIATASKTIGRSNQITGTFAATSTRESTTNLLGFLDTTDGLGMSSKINWAHTLNAHMRLNLGYQFSRQSTRLTPYWQNRENISGQAGITGNDQTPTYWGPPTLNFSGGLTALTDGQSSFIRNATNGVSYIMKWNHSPHNITGGFDFRRQQFNYLSQANPRGTFSFTGAATAGGAANSGSDLADFLLGIPDASNIGFGNPDKYLRQSVYDAYLTDDWRVTPQLTIDAGARWEYGAPVTELKRRLVNLDVASGFSAIAPVLASDPVGKLTGQRYPASLMRPDRSGVQPRIGIAWRPIPGSSMVVNAGYGMNYDTSVYQSIAIQMAQQAPLAKSLTVQNSATCPLTLANGFEPCSTTTPQTFGVDPNFRVGYVHTWNLKVQRDLPGSLQMVATYLGIKGTRGVQEFLPNTNPIGAANPCPNCPTGFEYLVSQGNSTRESGQIQLRRRLHSGFTASVLYTFSKSIDDDSALGGQGTTTESSTTDTQTQSSATIAQDWRNLSGERGLSNFDQRHLLNVQVQYTTGMGMAGGSLMTGWRGRLYKEWTVQTQITAGSGLPQTPIDSSVVVAGYSAFVRPSVTGESLYAAPPGLFLNPGAYKAPPLGQWGDARRNSITGPSQFSLDAAMVRTFRLKSKTNLDLQIAATNILNHVTYSNWQNSITSTQFGLPAAAMQMRSLQTSLHLRF
ncbi:TonB-dependent receptor [Granulicella sp. L56]|uniref:TonB-dependent receptor n=1 Tax=Granulicella sp. L56 TaxID=1747222 RepID=UPI0020B10A79|nr:TonB-dependent receptor [Granulicella sp. L56]